MLFHDAEIIVKQSDNVAVLDKALDLLECLVEGGNQTVAELSDATGVTKAAAYRILSTLERRGYVVTFQKVRRYSIGSAFHAYVEAARKSDLLLDFARPAMRGLWDASGETVNLGILARGKILYLDVIESQQGLRATSQAGTFDTVHSTALGKAILSRLEPADRDDILASAKLVSRTEHTVTDAAGLRRSIETAAGIGWAVDDQENEIGMRCVAAPIVNGDGWPVAAISVSAPSSRMSDEALERIGNQLVAACAKVSERLIDVGSPASITDAATA